MFGPNIKIDGKKYLEKMYQIPWRHGTAYECKSVDKLKKMNKGGDFGEPPTTHLAAAYFCHIVWHIFRHDYGTILFFR